MRTKCRMPSKYIWELNFFHTKITNFNCKTQADGYMCIVVQAAGSINPSAKCISLHSFKTFASLAYLKLTSTFGNCLVWVKSQLEEIRSLDNYISHHRAWSVLLSQFQTKHWTMNLRRGGGAERLTDNYTIPKQRLFILPIYKYKYMYTSVFKNVLIWEYI